MIFRKYFYRKAKQLKHASWFCAGFFVAGGFSLLGIISLGLAVVFDFLSCYIQNEEKRTAAD